MNTLNLVFGLGFIFNLHLVSNAAKFTYDGDGKLGPENWPIKFPACGGSSQTPINVEINQLNRGVFVRPLKLRGLKDSKLESITVKNQLLIVIAKFNWVKSAPTLSGGPLKSVYLLDSLHFHWGILNDDGSEHAINGEKSALEAHFVFFNSKYGSFENALNFSDGITVLGILFDLDEHSPDLDVLEFVKFAVEEGTEYTINQSFFDFGQLIPDSFIYATYKGSFTTPPCREIVNWFVSMEKLKVNLKQLKQLRRFYDSLGRPLANNFRPLEPINNREVLLGLINSIS